MVSNSAASDEQRELAQLWMQAQPRVFSFVCAAVARRHDAEDLLQQVALEAASSFGNYDQSRPFLPWVLTIARRRVSRFYERQKRQPAIFAASTLEMLADYHAHSTRFEEEQVALYECVGKLDEKSRRLLTMRYDDELSTVDMAQQTGLTSGSVRVMLSRIRKQLVDCVLGKLRRNHAQ